MKFDVSVADGKYIVHFDNGSLRASRYGDTWRDLTGDNLVYFLAAELQGARDELAKLKGEQT